MARKKYIPDTENVEQFTDQVVALAEFAATALIAAQRLRIKEKVVGDFPLNEEERTTAAGLLTLSPKIKRKLAKDNASFTVAETSSIVLAVAESLLIVEPKKQVVLLMAAGKLLDCLQAELVMADVPAKSEKSKPTDALYQFKITLLNAEPPIWRRIQVQDCTLDKLHEHIQTAMGWTNSHLHQFEIKGERYGDPQLLDDGFDDFECTDSTKTLLSDIVPKSRKRFSFLYEYDFGDSWEHEVLFEGSPPLEKVKKYPLCLEGERACPPEDCGGVWGYADLLEAIRNKRHEEHESMLEWIGSRFNAEEFDAKQATKAMKKGLPDWRSMR